MNDGISGGSIAGQEPARPPGNGEADQPSRGQADGRDFERQAPGSMSLAFRLIVIASLSGLYLTPTLLAILSRRAAPKRALSRRVVGLLHRLGPAFIKVGQLLGMRRDVLPPVLCDELSVLQDTVAPLSAQQGRAAFAALYGSRLHSLFDRIDFRPVASGSIACVYRGHLADGRVVAIKLRRPDVQKVMAADMRLVTVFASLAARMPPLRGAPVAEMIEYLTNAIYAQLDFAREAENLKRLREDLSRVPRVWVPRLVEEASCEGAVVMEFIPGLDTSLPERSSAVLRKRFAASTLAAVYRMLFVEGFVHCDLHPGNLYFTASGQVVVLDAGFSVRLSERIRRLFAEFFMNMSLGRGRRCAEIVIQSADGVHAEANVAEFKRRLASLVERNSGLAAGDFSLLGFATELFDLQRKHGLHASAELVFPLLSLLVIEGTVRSLDPDIDFQKAAEPILMKGVFGA